MLEAYSATRVTICTAFLKMLLNQPLSYTDADGATTHEFDHYGRPAKVTDPTGNTTFTYDRALEPRGMLTSATDSMPARSAPHTPPTGNSPPCTTPAD
jgi:YD repeat-containing protein